MEELGIHQDLLSGASESSKSTIEQVQQRSLQGDSHESESETPSLPKNTRIDESTLSPDEAKKLKKRRAYNRECASRARKRTKVLLNQLQEEVTSLQREKEALSKANSALVVEVQLYKRERDRVAVKHELEKQQILRSCLLPQDQGALLVGSDTSMGSPSSVLGLRTRAQQQARRWPSSLLEEEGLLFLK